MLTRKSTYSKRPINSTHFHHIAASKKLQSFSAPPYDHRLPFDAGLYTGLPSRAKQQQLVIEETR